MGISILRDVSSTGVSISIFGTASNVGSNGYGFISASFSSTWFQFPGTTSPPKWFIISTLGISETGASTCFSTLGIPSNHFPVTLNILAAKGWVNNTALLAFVETFCWFSNTFKALFGGGKAKLVLDNPEDILNTGIDIDVQPPGKSVKSIRLFSGGEKTLIAICVLFTILKIRPVPLIVFDEVEAALDQANVERFAKYVKTFAEDSQFIIITHRPGTMAQCDVLYGVTMQHRGVSQMLKVKLVDAIEMAEKSEVNL